MKLRFITICSLFASLSLLAQSINFNPWTTNNAIVASNITASLITGGQATNSIDVAVGTNTLILTNLLLRTISATTDTNVVNALAAVAAQNSTNTARLAVNLAGSFDALNAALNATNTARLAVNLAGTFDPLNAALNATNAGNLAFLTADQHFSGKNQFSGSNNFTGTLVLEGAVRTDDGSLISTNIMVITNNAGSAALRAYGDLDVNGNIVMGFGGGFKGLIASGAATNAANSRVAYLSDITGGNGAPWATVVSAGDASVTVVTNSSGGTNNYTLTLSGSGINAATATNIAAYQALIATNGMIGEQNNWTASNYFGAGLGGNISSTTASIGTANITNAYGLISRGNVTNQSGFRIAYLDDTNSIYTSLTGYADAATNQLAVSSSNRWLPLGGGVVSGAVTTTSSSSNAPSALEFPTASWVRSLFNNGLIDYATSNIDNTATNPATLNQVVYQFWQGVIPQSSVRTWASGFITNNGYIGSVMTTNTFTVLDGTLNVNAFLGATTAGSLNNFFLTMHPEIYYSYDKTNWLGDYTANAQSITGNATNLYSWVVTFPTIIATNPAGFYVQRRLKVDTASTAGNVPTVYFMVGTNLVSGTANASHISISGPNSALGNAYLGNNQTFTGTNTFTVGTRTFLHDSSHTLITNTATLTSSEWTAGSQKEWYNGTATMTIDKTNGVTTANGHDYSTNALSVVGNGTATMDMSRTYALFITNANFTLSLANVPTVTDRPAVLIVSNSLASGNTILLTASGFSFLTNGVPTQTAYLTNLTAKNQVAYLSVNCYGPALTNAVLTHFYNP